MAKAHEPEFRLADTIQVIRKTTKTSQATLGKLLSVHQTAVCRIEQGSQELTSHQLFSLSQHFMLPVDSLMTGEIDYWKLAERFDCLPPFSNRYRLMPFSKVRESLPVLRLLQDGKGQSHLKKILSRLELDPVFLRSPDQAIGVNACLDLLRIGISSGKISKHSLAKLTKESLADSVQGFLDQVYSNQTDSISLIQSRILNASHYETNFSYQIEELSQTSIEISITPAEHMREVEYKDDVLGDFLCVSRKDYLSKFPQYIGEKPIKVTENGCHFHGAKKCVYLLKTA